MCCLLVKQKYSRQNLGISKEMSQNVCSCTPCTPSSVGPVNVKQLTSFEVLSQRMGVPKYSLAPMAMTKIKWIQTVPFGSFINYASPIFEIKIYSPHTIIQFTLPFGATFESWSLFFLINMLIQISKLSLKKQFENRKCWEKSWILGHSWEATVLKPPFRNEFLNGKI